MPNPLTDAANHVLAADKELQARVRGLIDGLLTEAESQLAVGTPAVRLSLLKTVLPAIVKEARAHEQDGQVLALMAQVNELMLSTRANIGPQTDTDTGIPTDTPPHPILSLVQNATTAVMPPVPNPDRVIVK